MSVVDGVWSHSTDGGFWWKTSRFYKRLSGNHPVKKWDSVWCMWFTWGDVSRRAGFLMVSSSRAMFWTVQWNWRFLEVPVMRKALICRSIKCVSICKFGWCNWSFRWGGVSVTCYIIYHIEPQICSDCLWLYDVIWVQIFILQAIYKPQTLQNNSSSSGELIKNSWTLWSHFRRPLLSSLHMKYPKTLKKTS